VVTLAADGRLLYKEEVLRESPAVTIMRQYFPTTLLRPLDIKCARNIIGDSTLPPTGVDEVYVDLS